VSRRERQNADVFFADLMGPRRLRGDSGEQHAESFFEALVGPATPRPRALIEALESEQAPGPTVTPGADKDEIIVTRADGTRFHVRRRVRAQLLTRPGRPRVGLCTDDERVFFRLAWCEGTQGRIDAGANPQGAFKKLLDTVLDQIGNRATPEQIKQTIENASIQTFLDVDITKVGSWKITGDVKLDMNRTGITSTSAGVAFDRGWFKIGVEFKTGQDGQQVMVTLDIPLEKRTIQGKQCPVRELIVWWDVECFREVPITVPLRLPGVLEKTERLFLYFDFARDTLRREAKPAAATPADEIEALLKSDPKVGTARLNKRSLERLDYLVGQGYWLTKVDGFTSPEGLRQKPRDPRLAAKWEGNDALSSERADKVRKLIEARYVTTPGLRMRLPLMRFPPDQTMPQGVGRSETPRLDDRLGREVEGPQLDRAIVLGDKTLSVKPFLDDHPEELARMTAEDQAFVTNTRNSVRDRAERVFENLRRVEIHLKHREPFQPTRVATFLLQQERPCAKDLIDAAEHQWGSRIPFTRPDPPICQ
jgi:hypothetical protein